MVEDPFENSQADVISVTKKNAKFVIATEAEDTINITYNKIIKQHFLSLKVGDNEFSIWITKDDLRKLMAVIREVIEYEE